MFVLVHPPAVNKRRHSLHMIHARRRCSFFFSFFFTLSGSALHVHQNKSVGIFSPTPSYTLTPPHHPHAHPLHTHTHTYIQLISVNEWCVLALAAWPSALSLFAFCTPGTRADNQLLSLDWTHRSHGLIGPTAGLCAHSKDGKQNIH